MDELGLLVITAASIAFFHTLLGPDHYLPFIMMARAGKWSARKTALITFLCGLGHVASSVLLGLFGAALGVSLARLEMFESFRANVAAWCLIAFGLLYAVWGMRQAYRNRPHRHTHLHENGSVHTHVHVHTEEHMHVHQQETAVKVTPWVLFTIFVFGPCEPLIPILMYPAAKLSVSSVLIVSGVFSVCTISTMLAVVLAASAGMEFLPFKRLERYTHALAGGTIFLCGLGIVVLGL